MQKIFDALDAIYNFLINFFTYLKNFVQDIFTSAWDFFKDMFYWFFETIINLAVSVIQSLDVSAINNHIGAFGSIPAEILNVCGLLHMGTCLSILAGAITIRLLLQLIPFVRLGS